MELIGAQMKYSKFPCAEHSDEPLKAEIVQNKNDLIQQTDSEVFTNIKI